MNKTSLLIFCLVILLLGCHRANADVLDRDSTISSFASGVKTTPFVGTSISHINAFMMVGSDFQAFIHSKLCLDATVALDLSSVYSFDGLSVPHSEVYERLAPRSILRISGAYSIVSKNGTKKSNETVDINLNSTLLFKGKYPVQRKLEFTSGLDLSSEYVQLQVDKSWMYGNNMKIDFPTERTPDIYFAAGIIQPMMLTVGLRYSAIANSSSTCSENGAPADFKLERKFIKRFGAKWLYSPMSNVMNSPVLVETYISDKPLKGSFTSNDILKSGFMLYYAYYAQGAGGYLYLEAGKRPGVQMMQAERLFVQCRLGWPLG